MGIKRCGFMPTLLVKALRGFLTIFFSEVAESCAIKTHPDPAHWPPTRPGTMRINAACVGIMSQTPSYRDMRSTEIFTAKRTHTYTVLH